jgi:dephospho-CoA kinase
MGKSTTAGFFRAAGVPVWDADATVHRLYATGGEAVPILALLVPETVRDGAVDRARLRAAVLADAGLLARIEAAVHPLVAADRARFLDTARSEGAPLAVCDIPLLYETGAEAGLDRVLVVTAPEAVQRTRVLERPGMTEAAFRAILARQLPDEAKRARADFVIDTAQGFDATRAAVGTLIRRLTEGEP